VLQHNTLETHRCDQSTTFLQHCDDESNFNVGGVDFYCTTFYFVLPCAYQIIIISDSEVTGPGRSGLSTAR